MVLRLSAADIEALLVTAKLALLSTVILLLLSTPLAWWLATTRSRLRAPLSAILSLPLILPPTVIGFYLLFFMGPDGFLGELLSQAGMSPLVFTFSGLVVGSVIYSLPFVVQPIQTSMESIGIRPLEVAATLRAGPWDTFVSVVLPMAVPGLIRAAVIGFAHTVGEFGVVLMIGGNIPGQTRVISVQLYEHVESLEYGQAHSLAALLLVFSFISLLVLAWVSPRRSLSR